MDFNELNNVSKKTHVIDKKSSISRLSKPEKAEFTDVNAMCRACRSKHFSGKSNEESGLFLQTLNITYPIKLDADFFFSPTLLSDSGYKKISSFPLYILIGLTGSGKSTLIKNLTKTLHHLTVLPNRREITSKCIIEPLQLFSGKPIAELQRTDRYFYVSRFREFYPEGMAYILDNIYIKNNNYPCLIFDGLRNYNEVKYAIEKFPKAFFIALTTSDFSRMNRLMYREDPYDILSRPCYRIPEKKITKLSEIDELFSVFDFSEIEKNKIIDLINASNDEFYKVSGFLKILAKDKQLNNLYSSIALLKKYALGKSCIYNNTYSEATEIAEKVLREVFEII